MLGCCDPSNSSETRLPQDPPVFSNGNDTQPQDTSSSAPPSDALEFIGRLQRFPHRVDASRFVKGQFLANGGQGAVYEARLDGHPVAAKQFHQVAYPDPYGIHGRAAVEELYRPGNDLAVAVRELEVLAALPQHQNVIGFVGVVVGVLHSVIVPMFILTELMPDGSLEQLLKEQDQNMTAAGAMQVIIGIFEGLKHLHEQNPPLVHRDIKPKNILVDRATLSVKIADFGFARPPGNTQFRFTPAYVPRWALGAEAITTKVDVFAAGVTFFELLGLDPQQSQTPAYRNRALGIANRFGRVGVMLFSCLGETAEACPDAEQVLGILQSDRESTATPALGASGPANSAPAPMRGAPQPLQELPLLVQGKCRTLVALLVLAAALVPSLSPFVFASGGDCEDWRVANKHVSSAIILDSSFLFDHICHSLGHLITAFLLVLFLCSIRRGPLWAPGLPRRFMHSVLLYFFLSLGLLLIPTSLTALRECFAGTVALIEAPELSKVFGSPARAVVLGHTTTVRLEALQPGDTCVLYRLLNAMVYLLVLALSTHLCLRLSGAVSDYADNIRWLLGVAGVLGVFFSIFTGKAIAVYWRTWKWVRAYTSEHAPPDETLLLQRCRARVLRSVLASLLSLTSTLALWGYWSFVYKPLGGAHLMRVLYTAESIVNDVCVCFMSEFWDRAVPPLTEDFQAASRAARRHQSQLRNRAQVSKQVQVQLSIARDFLAMLQGDRDLLDQLESVLHTLSHVSWRVLLQYQWDEDRSGISVRWELWKRLVESSSDEVQTLDLQSEALENSDTSLDETIERFNEASWPFEVGLSQREWPLRLRHEAGGIVRVGELDTTEAETLSAGDPYELLAFESFLQQKWGAFQRHADPTYPSAEALREGRPTPSVRIRRGERCRFVQLLLRDHGEIWCLARQLLSIEQSVVQSGLSRL